MASRSEATLEYARVQLRTATHPRVIWMMHSRAALWIRQSELFEMPHRRNCLSRAQNVLAELEASLKVTDELSKGLFYLYDYCYILLDTANADDHRLAQKVLSILSIGFSQLLKRQRRELTMT